jgi:5-oxoprolinase (ATP-hydrolysing)
VALAITRGFGDALRIGYQARPGDFRAAHRAAVDALRAVSRSTSGRRRWRVLVPLDEEQAREALGGARQGIDALAIVLMHGWRYPAHERGWRDRARARLHAGLGQPRGRAADQAGRARRYDGGRRLSVAGAAPLRRPGRGGLPTGPTCISCSRTAASPKRRAFRGKDAILSGPAGGVVGMVAASAPHGGERLIGFDMGGTSTDVSHYAGRSSWPTKAWSRACASARR